MTLKNKAIKGFSWTVFEGIFSQGFLFIVGIVLARLLTVEEFGIIGIITAIIAISSSIVEGGMGSALIRKLKTTSRDYNTVFYSNLAIAIFLYGLILASSYRLSVFFGEPLLDEILKYSGTLLIIHAFSIIQRALLTKNLDFRTQAMVSISASIGSGVVAVVMAYRGYGVWSLVVMSILRPFMNTALLWVFNSWKPALEFSLDSFRELFNFGYKVLVTNLINTAYRNIYYILIGKFFSTQSLGFYTQAEKFQTPFSTNITTAIRRISFPILSKFQNDEAVLKQTFIRFLRYTLLLNFTVMLAIAAMARPIVLLLIGEKWETSIFYLQLLCIPGMLYPLQMLHLNLILVKGYSNLYLRLELIKKAILFPLIFTTVFFGIEAMLYGLVLFAFIEYFINSYYTKKFINYRIKDQLLDMLPFFVIAFGTFLGMFGISLLNLDLVAMLCLQIFSGGLTFVLINEISKPKEYLEIKYKIIDLCRKSINKVWPKK